MIDGCAKKIKMVTACAGLSLLAGLAFHNQAERVHADAKAVGSLTVKIKPKEAKQDGARWRVDGGAWQKSGKTESNVSEGNHSLQFKPTFGWQAPANKIVSIQANHETKESGKYKTPKRSVVLPGDIVLEYVEIGAGTFAQGAYDNEQDTGFYDKPQHQVTLASFQLGKYEVTKAQWQALMHTTPWTSLQHYISDPNSPAVNVSWDNAQSFIDALNTHVINTHQGSGTFRLPSESEWEYACRAGTFTRFYWGDDGAYTGISTYAWWDENADSANQRYAHIVGTKTPNTWGLYDMSGNVGEWCEDDFDNDDYDGAPTDGSAWIMPDACCKMVRGGTWADDGKHCRSANRSGYNGIFGFDTVGFRIAR